MGSECVCVYVWGKERDVERPGGRGGGREEGSRGVQTKTGLFCQSSLK